MGRKSLLLLIAASFLAACSVRPAVSTGISQVSVPSPTALAAVPATSSHPTENSTPTAAAVQSPIPTSALSSRWFWAISEDKKEILAFTAGGQVNSILDLSGLDFHSGFLLRRTGDAQAFVLFPNNGRPKAYLLSSNAATALSLPAVQIPNPKDIWAILAEHAPYLVASPASDATAPAILIDTQTGRSSLVAPDVVGPDDIHYLIRFSADGRFLRYATSSSLSDAPVVVNNRDLQSGKDSATFQGTSYLNTDSFGELWYDSSLNTAHTALGEPVSLKKQGDAVFNMPLDNGWNLETLQDCGKPCSLTVYPLSGSAPPLKYSLPVQLVSSTVFIEAALPLDQNRLLVSIYGDQSSPLLTSLWILTPDGSSQYLGKGFQNAPSSEPPYQFPGASADGRYLLCYLGSDPPAFGVYDLVKGSPLFIESLDQPDAYLQGTFFPEGILVLEQGSTSRQWVYAFGNGTAVEIKPPTGIGGCTALTPDGKPICMTRMQDGVVIYDPSTGSSTPLIQEPVTDLSN